MQQQRRRPPVALSPVALNNNSNRPIRQSTRSSSTMPPTVSQCFGCSQPMYNQFISNVLDHLWHPECVRCFVCRSLLNEQCYSREGKLYCKDDFIKKYIHRCFACQNLVQSHELIRRIRAGRIYHAECFVCSKCKRTLQDDDITSLLKTDGATLNDLECICQTCVNPNKSSDETSLLPNGDENKTKDNEISNKINGKASPTTDLQEEKPSINGTTAVNNHTDEQQSMDVDEPPPPPSLPSLSTIKPSISPAKEHSPPPVTPPPPPPPAKTTGRQSKVRQSTSSNGSKRSPVKSKTTPVSRQKQTTANERKGRSPATRSKSTGGASNNTSAAQRRSSNRRTTKSTRYRKRSFSSGSDEDETEDDEEDDTDFSDEDNIPDNEKETSVSPAIKNKSSTNHNEKKSEPEPTPVPVPSQPVPPPPPPQTATNPSLLSQAKMSEPLSLLSGLAANPMSISSIMKPDATPSFMPPNFNPAFPTPSQFLPPGFPLQPRLPMPPPPSSSSSSITTTQLQSAPIPDSNRSSHSANASDTDSLDRSSSPSQMDVSTNVEPGTPARPVTPPKVPRQSSSSAKPSALSSLLEFGTLPPSSLGDIRSSSGPTNPFPFPFVTPGPGVPFSPQAAAGMATFYRPPFGIPPSAMPLDMTQSNSNSSKKKSDTTDNEEIISQNLLDDSSTSAPAKKKARKSNSRSKAKAAKVDIDPENGMDEDNTSTPPPPAPPVNKRKKKLKADVTENGNTNDSDETKITNGNGNGNNHSHNLFAQMGLMNNSFMPPPMPPSSASTTNGKSPTPNSQQAQQAQLAAMYNMAPHFAAYNAFQGAFNPAFAGAFGGGYPAPYGFHPAFGATNPGQPFPFMPPTPSSTGSPLNNTSTSEDKPSSIVVPETRPPKSRSKSTTGGEKKKPATPRGNKKKSLVPSTSTDLPVATEGESVQPPPSIESIAQMATTPEPTSTPTKRQMSATDSEDFDDQQHSQPTNGKSGNESDGSMGDGDRSLNTAPSTSSSTAPEKKGARTTIRPQQLDVLCKAYDSCSKPNKAQREQLVADTGLSLRVIQVWFQNRRSKERKGKPSKERETGLDDDDEAGDDSQPSSPPPPPTTSESIPVNNTTET
ncbi:unnamed protein product [Adineta steineri]|uniref:Uncharacterized protein n=1 Tax=Adineta steineri TaxID=433720 RepID=A0A814HNX4_9BILA|nr:unnamed protein product [Adineta steineri]CAF1250772.1 unnamed protein product [Adineta steineri]